MQANLYRKCSELPIHNFNEVSSNGDFSYLKKNRNDEVSNTELELCWLNILDEYFTLTDNPMAVANLKKRIRLILMDRKLEVLNALKLCIERNVNVDSELKEYRTSKQKITIHIGMLMNDIQRVQKSLPKENEEKQSATNFDDSIAFIIENGYQINRHTTVVSEYCSILKRIKLRKQKAQQ